MMPWITAKRLVDTTKNQAAELNPLLKREVAKLRALHSVRPLRT